MVQINISEIDKEMYITKAARDFHQICFYSCFIFIPQNINKCFCPSYPTKPIRINLYTILIILNHSQLFLPNSKATGCI